MNAVAHRLPHLAQRLFNTPIAITPEKAEIVMAALADRFGVARLFSRGGVVPVTGPLAFDDGDGGMFSARAPEKPFDLVAGVAVVPVQGTLVHKLGSVRPYSGMTGYDGIRNAVLAALADAQVRGIMLDIDSPGGEVAGAFDLADMIFRARGIKPIWAVLDENAYSAAYAIASAADRITIPRTGGAGSIGVVWLHTDLSQALEAGGIKVTIVRSGARKFEGSAYEPLSDTARARAEVEVRQTADLFFRTVERNRAGKGTAMSAGDIEAMQGASFTGERAVLVRLADAVLAPDEAFRAFRQSLN